MSADEILLTIFFAPLFIFAGIIVLWAAVAIVMLLIAGILICFLAVCEWAEDVIRRISL